MNRKDWLEWAKAHLWHLGLAGVAMVLLVGIGINRSQQATVQDLPEIATLGSSSQHTVVSSTSEARSSTSSGLIMVDVKGAVNKPGVYQVDADSRVTDVIKLAGGFSANANQKSVNLAQKLTDEAVVYVAANGEPIQEVTQPGAPSSGSATQSSGVTEKVNLNTATAQELQTIPGIGEKRAQDIIAYREEKGGFTSVDELKNISGIGDKTFEKIKDEVEV